MDEFDIQYWESRFTAARDDLTIAELELLLLEPGADRSAFEADRRRCARRVWSISLRVAESRRG